MSITGPRSAFKKTLKSVVTSWDSTLGYGYVRLAMMPPPPDSSIIPAADRRIGDSTSSASDGTAASGASTGVVATIPHLLSNNWSAAGLINFGVPAQSSAPQWLIARKLFQLPKTIRAAEVDLAVGDCVDVTYTCNDSEGGFYLVHKVHLLNIHTPNRSIGGAPGGFFHSKRFRVRGDQQK
ncbi:Hypothetical protein, putative [Bodo saltans]|uniref:Uncharacterized protein n=1 Tax=Bodo saltans TaxID=75058 RepID=A0A0S4IPD5_BODSA|nr:Hypothetical protein, putative [Bodo saltans]|eukprot:CUE98369.1 Hypothetical protein, putative [Bodo saltans]